MIISADNGSVLLTVGGFALPVISWFVAKATERKHVRSLEAELAELATRVQTELRDIDKRQDSMEKTMLSDLVRKQDFIEFKRELTQDITQVSHQLGRIMEMLVEVGVDRRSLKGAN